MVTLLMVETIPAVTYCEDCRRTYDTKGPWEDAHLTAAAGIPIRSRETNNISIEGC